MGSLETVFTGLVFYLQVWFMTEFSHIFLGFDEVGLFVLLFPFRVIQRFARLLRL